MKRPIKRASLLGGILLLALSIASFVYWASFIPATGLIEGITFVESGDQSQLITYSVDDTEFDAEFTFDGFEDGEVADILVDKSDNETYQLAPSTATEIFTALVGLVGALMLSRTYRTRI